MIRSAICLAVALLATPALADDAAPAQPEGYRMEHFRAPVPAALTGATTIDAAQAHQLWQEGRARFVDVWPRPPKPKGLPEGSIWREVERQSIPGAIWLPNVGYGALADVTEDYFKRGLTKASGGNLSQPLVIYCLEDCWMSWNAAKRALGYGYQNIYWLPTGTDGWSAAGYPTELVEAEPEP